MKPSRREFILAHTRLRSPPLVPEVELYLGEEIIPIWRTLDTAWGVAGASPPFWAFAWAGGQALSRYLLDRREEIAGKRVLDFAAGSGICAICAAKLGAREVIAVDIDPFSIEAVTLNAVANEVRVTVWERDLLDGDLPEVDLLLAGDICYEEPMAARVLPWLRKGYARDIRILLGDPGRAYFPDEEVTLLAEYDVPTSRDLEDSELKRTGIYIFRAPKRPSTGLDASNF